MKQRTLLEGIPGKELSILLGVMVAALILDTYCLGCKSLWWDEGYTLAATQQGWSEIANGLVSAGSNPLFLILVRVWGAFGQGEAFIRALSVLPAVATVPAIYLLGRELFGAQTGLLAAGLISINSFVVEFAQEARGYSLALFLITLSSLLLVRAVKYPTRRKWMGYGVVTILALATHIFALGVVVAQLVALAWTRPQTLKKDWVRTVLATLLVLTPILALPVLWFIFARTGLRWIPTAGRADLVIVPLTLAGQTQAFSRLIFLSPSGAVLLVTNAVAAIPLFLLSRDFMTKGRSPALWPHALLVLWFAIPVVGSFVASFIFPMFLDRYLIVVVPAIALLTAVGLLRLPHRVLSGFALAVICAIAVLSLRNYYEDAKEDWRGVAAHVQSHTARDDGLILYTFGGANTFSYYARRDPRPDPEFTYPYSGDTFDGSDIDRLFTLLRTDGIEHERIWFITSHAPLEDSTERMSDEHIELRQLLYSNFRIVDRELFVGIKLELLQRS
ncbi:MAG TPA: glycosyltransferase family 39 protein [Actinomycetota bacterium]|nr:glycosyltransferase family 39 protein [Actinomycetota bacterium]